MASSCPRQIGLALVLTLSAGARSTDVSGRDGILLGVVVAGDAKEAQRVLDGLLGR